MTSSSQRTAGGEDRHQGDHDQHDRAAADVLLLAERAGERAEEGVRLVAGRLGEDVGDAVGGGDDGVEDQRGEGGGQHRQPQEADGLADRRAERHAADGAFGDGEQPQHEGEDRGGGEDDGVLLEELGVGEVDGGRVLDGLGQLVDGPGGGVGAAAGEGGEGVEGVADAGGGGGTRSVGGGVAPLAVLAGVADDVLAVLVAARGRRGRGIGEGARGQQDGAGLYGGDDRREPEYAVLTGHT